MDVISGYTSLFSPTRQFCIAVRHMASESRQPKFRAQFCHFLAV